MNMDVCVCCCVMDKDGKGTKVMCGASRFSAYYNALRLYVLLCPV